MKGIKNRGLLIAVITGILLVYACREFGESPKAELVLMWGKSGAAEGEFNQPIGIAVDNEGYVYVSDSGNDRIQKFSNDGKFVDSLNDTYKLNIPIHMDADSKNNLYVTEYGSDRVRKLSSSGQVIIIFGKTGKGIGEFDAPSGVAVDKSGNTYVADFYNHRVQRFSPEGGFLNQIGEPGQGGSGKLHYPTDVSVGKDGNIYVADAYNNRIQVFRPDGVYVIKWGGDSGKGDKGDKPGWFDVVTGIDTDTQGRVYVADFYNNRVQVFSPDGEFITSFGKQGSREGEFERPTDVAVDNHGNIFVADWGNNRIQKFSMSIKK